MENTKILNLTETDIFILNRLVLGYTRKDIAKNLDISYGKCLKIIKNIQTKLGTENLIVSAVWAMKKGYIKLKDGIPEDR